MDLSYKTISELQELLGERLKALRIARGLTQSDLAAKGGCSLRAVQNMEAGKGSSVETLLRFLKAVDGVDALDSLAPEPMISPMAMLVSGKRPMRVRRASPKRENF